MTMDKRKARRIGVGQAIQASALLFVLGEMALFLQLTRHDRTHGLLYFMQTQTSPLVIGALVFLFLPSLLFGSRAGVEIIVLGRNWAWTALKFAVIAILAIALFIYFTVRSYNLSQENTTRLLLVSLLPLAAALLAIWFIATWGIKRRSPKG
jgi:hypothetical protein